MSVKRASIVLPAYNAEAHLARVLEPLRDLGEQWEILVVDDGSGDSTWSLLSRLPVQAWRAHRCQGQSRARNWAAQQATGEYLVFLDSDVLTSARTLQEMVLFLEARPELDGVFGCYADSGCPEESSLSRFRNLLHRYVHRCGAGPAGSFWAGLGVIRRQTFLRHGGFDSRLDGIEDVELGARICRSGGKFWLEPSFEGHHLKRWTLASMVCTDIFVRAAPWTYYGWMGKTPRQGLNLSPAQALAPLLLPLCFLWPGAWFLYLLANVRAYRFFAQSGGPGLGLVSVLYLTIHHLCCLGGAALGSLRYLAWRTTTRSCENTTDA